MVLNERGVGKICDFQPIRRWQSETGHTLWRLPMAIKETSLPYYHMLFYILWVNLDFVLLGFQTCTAVAHLLCVSWAFLVLTSSQSLAEY